MLGSRSGCRIPCLTSFARANNIFFGDRGSLGRRGMTDRRQPWARTDAGRRRLRGGMADRRPPSLFLSFLALSAVLHPAGVNSAVPDAVDAWGRRQVLATPAWASFFATPQPLAPPAHGMTQPGDAPVSCLRTSFCLERSAHEAQPPPHKLISPSCWLVNTDSERSR